jgi:hypothetical protein
VRAHSKLLLSGVTPMQVSSAVDPRAPRRRSPASRWEALQLPPTGTLQHPEGFSESMHLGSSHHGQACCPTLADLLA